MALSFKNGMFNFGSNSSGSPFQQKVGGFLANAGTPQTFSADQIKNTGIQPDSLGFNPNGSNQIISGGLSGTQKLSKQNGQTVAQSTAQSAGQQTTAPTENDS